MKMCQTNLQGLIPLQMLAVTSLLFGSVFLSGCASTVYGHGASTLNTFTVPTRLPSTFGRAYIVAQGKGYFPVAQRLHDSRIAVVMRAGAGHLGITGRLEIIFSTDEGKTWSSPVIVAQSTADNRNPAFGQTDDGTLVVAYYVTENYDERGTYNTALKKPVRTLVTRSFDGGKAWQEPNEIDVSDIQWGSPYGKILTLDDGTMLMNIYGGEIRTQGHSLIDDKINYSYLYRSDDKGLSWHRWSSTGIKGFNETAIAALPDGSLLAALRRQSDAATFIASSSDVGQNWTKPALLAPSRFHPADLVTLPSGELLITVGNRSRPYGASGLVTQDGSFSWDRHFDITIDAANDDCGYPSSVVLKDGRVLTFYYSAQSKTFPRIGAYLGAVEYEPKNHDGPKKE